MVKVTRQKSYSNTESNSFDIEGDGLVLIWLPNGDYISIFTHDDKSARVSVSRHNDDGTISDSLTTHDNVMTKVDGEETLLVDYTVSTIALGGTDNPDAETLVETSLYKANI